ncbi:MAG: LysE family transporter, partial [Pseudomonadota bacterium]
IYLVFIGVSLLRSAALGSSASVRGLNLARGPKGAFRLGLITVLSNPKTAAFFTSLFAVTMPPSAPFWLEAIVVGIVVAICVAWYALVALAMRSAPFQNLYRRGQRAITALSGALFAAFGIRLASNG